MTNAGFLPDRVVAGETIWLAAANTVQDGEDLIFTDYTPSGYTLAYQFAADTPIEVAAVANGAGTGWTLEVTAAQTLLWKPGRIAFAGYVTDTNSGRKFAVDSGAIAVTPSPLATSTFTAALTACDAAIANYAANPHGSVSLGAEFSFTYRRLDELLALRDWLKGQIAADTGNRTKRIIRTRFT